MIEASGNIGTEPGPDNAYARPLRVFASWRLQAYGYTLAALYAAFFIYALWTRQWLLSSDGVPVYHDFTRAFVAGSLALHGQAALIYDPALFISLQEAVVGPNPEIFSLWPYPPTFFLVLAPLALLPYAAAFLIWDVVTLAACVAVVCSIARSRPAIALVLASPFAAWNFLLGQTGFLSAFLVGVSLLALEQRPVLAGALIGFLTFKPQFGILFPLALLATNQWRALASAAVTTVFLAGVSIVAFGASPWAGFLREFAAQSKEVLILGPGQGGDVGNWGVLQTIYGAIRCLNGSAGLAWLAQGITTCVVAVAMWFVWRSPVRYQLKAAALSAGMLIATPYACAPDLAALAVPVAFLARDQICYGLLRGEQTILLVLFAASLLIIPTIGRGPVGAAISLTLFGLILRRALFPRWEPLPALRRGRL